MKIDQIAFYANSERQSNEIKQLFGLLNKEWIKDTVTASSRTIQGEGVNIAELQFNYDLGIELEIIRYIKGRHWHDYNILAAYGAFISHVGIHLEDHEEFPNTDWSLVQETKTISHTSEYLTTGPGKGRLYHYKIYQLSPGSYIKYIKRVHPHDGKV